MNFKSIQNQRGFGLKDMLFWVLAAAAGYGIFYMIRSHQEGFNARPATHSLFEDSK